MKQLKSSIEDLREIFEKSITVSFITEPFCFFDETANAMDVKKFMNEKDFDVIGVRQNGVINGYAYRKDLNKGCLIDYFKKFSDDEVLPNTIAIKEVLNSIKNCDHIFITSFGKIAGIITSGDMQKMPIRMWLFSLVSLIEMHMLRIINNEYPDDFWKRMISPARLKKAEDRFADLKKKNKEISLLDCLQFCDKREIIYKSNKILNNLRISSDDFYRLLKELESLRNNLAHAQDIITDEWPKIITLSNQAEELLKKCENI